MTFRLLCLLSLMTATGCRPPALPPAPAQPPVSPRPVPSSVAPAARPFEAITLQHVHNVHRVTDKVLSGSQPEGAAGLRELAGLGVKTIISVDGITPDAEGAVKLGMRYVHLPIGYGTVPADRGREIAKAIRELPGPIFIHCHHGKHRSAAAVAAACVMNGSLDSALADTVLKTFGTGANYKGLWASAREARRLDDATLAAVRVDYTARSPISDTAASMVKIDDHFEHLKQIQMAGWSVPADHPDLDPPHEALQLEEHLVEMGRAEYTRSEPAAFHHMLRQNAEQARTLRGLLGVRPVDGKAADAALKAVGQSCLNCHQAYRDQ